jgi:tRNA G18 (ribose-2'-O)-methylase SpoU
MNDFIILENIRSCYNVWNIIRTADALWWDIILSWYTPSPFEETKILKTSLWSEKSINIKQFYNTADTIKFLRKNNYLIIVAEITNEAIPLNKFIKKNITDKNKIAIIFWNETDWVLKETMEKSDKIVYIPMKGIKESLNVWQSTAIFMREFWKKIDE